MARQTHSEAELISLTSERAYEVWYPEFKPAHSSRNKLALHDYARDMIGVDTDLRYLEFGVHGGSSISRFSSIFTNPNAEFYGFDSFVGLPEQWGSMPQGHFSTDGRLPDLTDPRITLIKGWFQNSAPIFMPSLRFRPPKTTLVHFDADLYSSTLFILSSLWWFLPDYYMIFDEFVGHELAALRMFVSVFPVELQFFSRVDTPAGEPIQVFGHIRNCNMVVEGLE